MTDEQLLLTILNTSFFRRIYEKEERASPVTVRAFCENVLSFMRSSEYFSHLEMTPIVFAVYPGMKGLYKFLGTKELEKKMNNGDTKVFNVFPLNYKGERVDIKDFDDSLILNNGDMSEISTGNLDVKFFFLDQNSLSIFFDGRVLEDIPNIHSLDRKRKYHNRIPVSKYQLLLDKYVSYFSKRGRSSIFWKRKKDWELIAGPEKYFIDDFYNFLQRNTCNGFIDPECLVSHTDDRLDVRVIEQTSGNIYIYEIKWIGRSDGGGGYEDKEAHKRANSGINQIENYLADETNCVKGILMVYDARKHKVDILWLNEELWNLRVHTPPCMIPFEPTSASVKASKKASTDFKEHGRKEQSKNRRLD